MIKSLSNVIDKSEFNYKALTDGQIKLNIKSIDSYRKITKFLEKEKFIYHTYQIKSERAFRFVIKGLHHSTPAEDIKAELIQSGHQVRYIVNIKSKFNKQPLPMFYVDIDPSPENKKVFDIRYLNNCVVQIEAPRTTSDIVQCHRCQEYGHTKTYCRKPFVCVKCGLGHPTPNCTKESDSPPRCVHCLKTHTANYKGCVVYQHLLRKRSPESRPLSGPQFIMNRDEFPHINPNYSNNKHNFNNDNIFKPRETYANVGNQNNIAENNSIMKNIEQLLNKQIELTTTLMNMMSLLLNKLCK